MELSRNGTSVPTGRDDTYNSGEVRRKTTEELFDSAFNEDQKRVLSNIVSDSDNEITQVADNLHKYVYKAVDFRDCKLLKGYINVGAGTFVKSDTQPIRCLILPVDGVEEILVDIPTDSTKRIGFADSFRYTSVTFYSTVIYDPIEVSGPLNRLFKNVDNHRYLIIQLFVNNDAIRDASVYLKTANVYFGMRNILSVTDDAKNINILPILKDISDVDVVTAAYNDCAAFHALMDTNLVSVSDGYITRVLLGEDNHGNSLYKYETFPEVLYYESYRTDSAPKESTTLGYPVKPFTVILTSNIHGRERNGNWVVYNLLRKILTDTSSDMIRFFRDRVKIIWVPYLCPTGDYQNSDGVNINRDFPDTADGTCVSPEATLLKGVIDTYAPEADAHIDIHTFGSGGSGGTSYASFSFTDSSLLATKGILTAKRVVDMYAAKYPDESRFTKVVTACSNTGNTCTRYTQRVYGIPAGTVEGVEVISTMAVDGLDSHTSAVAYLYDIITQLVCNMSGETVLEGSLETLLPTAPAADGSYVLTANVVNGVVTYSWES